MPSQQGNWSTIQGVHRPTLYLSILGRESIVHEGTVTAVNTTPPYMEFTFSTSAGSTSDVRVDFEVEFFTSGGVSKGRWRVAFGGITGSVMQVNETAQGRSTIVVGDTFRVYREIRPRDKLVAANATFDKDSRANAGLNNALIPPIANGGGPRIAWLRGSTPDVSFQHNGSQSRAMDSDNVGGLLTYLWDFRDGSGTSTTAANPVGTYAAGFRWITVTVRDENSLQSTVKYIPVMVHDDDNPPLEVREVQLNSRRGDGWSASFEMVSPALLADVPDGTMIALWTDETYNETEHSFGNWYDSGSNVKFLGWLARDESDVDASDTNLRFEAISTAAQFDRLPGFSQALIEASVINTWQTYRALSINRALWYLIYWHTTLYHLVDIFLLDIDILFPRLFLQTGTAKNQFLELAEGVSADVSSDRTGHLFIKVNLALQRNETIRNNAVVTAIITPDDILQATIARDHYYPVAEVEGQGFTSGSLFTPTDPAPVFAKAPGLAPAEASGYMVKDKYLVANETDLEGIVGHVFARLNKFYTYADNRVADVSLQMDGAFDVFDSAYPEWVKLTLPMDYIARGIAFNETRFLIESISVNWSIVFTPNGPVVDQNMSLEMTQETSGRPGTRFTPGGGGNIAPGGEVEIVEGPESGSGFEPGFGIATIGAANNDGNFYRTGSFDLNDPVWETVSLGVSGTPLSMIVDALSPSYLGTGSEVNIFVVTTSGIYKVSDVFGTLSASLKFTFANAGASVRNRVIEQAFATNALRLIVSSYIGQGGAGGEGIKITYSDDQGETWSTEAIISGHYSTSATYFVSPGLAISSSTPGLAYTSAFVSTGASPAGIGYVSTDYGETWSPIDGSPVNTPNMDGSGLRGCIEILRTDNPSQNRVFWASTTPVAGFTQWRTFSNGITTTSIGPSAPTGQYAAVTHKAIVTALTNGLNVAMAGRYNDGTASYGALFTAQDGGDGPGSWTQVTETTAANLGPTGVAIAGNDPNVGFAWGQAGFIGMFDFSGNYFDKRGNIPTDFPSAGRFLNICGG